MTFELIEHNRRSIFFALHSFADRNLNPHKGIHTPHARYDFVPDPIRPVVGMQELSWISTELFGVLSGLSHSVQMCAVN